jgi:Tfp pilus assembly protein PilO
MNLPIKVNEREKKFLIIGAIAVILIVLFNAFFWYSDTKKSVKDFSDARHFMLQKQINKIAEKDYILEKFNAVQQELQRQEKTLLHGNTPPVAAAALQRILKDIAASLNIDVKLERTLNISDARFYHGIPVEIGFTTTTRELKNMLFKLRKSPFLLTISEIKVRVTNISKPEEIYTTLVVTGYIKKAEEKETAKKEGGNAT